MINSLGNVIVLIFVYIYIQKKKKFTPRYLLCTILSCVINNEIDFFFLNISTHMSRD